MKMFEQTVESELEDSSGKYDTAAETNSRNRRADAVCDVICDVTNDNFLGPEWRQKKLSCSERYGGAQIVAKSPCH